MTSTITSIIFPTTRAISGLGPTIGIIRLGAPVVRQVGRRNFGAISNLGHDIASTSAASSVRLLSTTPTVSGGDGAVKETEESTVSSASGKKRVLVIGAGWGAFGFSRTLQNLSPKHFDITLVSPRNHMLFTPLLASTSVGTLEFRSIVEPVRSSLPHVRYQQGKVRSLDPVAKRVRVVTRDHRTKGDHDTPILDEYIDYDYCVMAQGARNNTFGIEGVKENVHFLKELGDSRELRRNILKNVETASFAAMPSDIRKRMLSWVVVGGGPTGVEFLGELSDFVEKDIAKYFPEVAGDISLTLVEGNEILSSFDASLRDYVMSRFARHKVDVILGNHVTRVTPTEVHLMDGTILTSGITVWSTGVGPRKMTTLLDSEQFIRGPGGRIKATESLEVLRGGADNAVWDGLYAIGDCAFVGDEGYPPTAQVAEQQGTHLAKQLQKKESGELKEGAVKPFEYFHKGSLAYIGGWKALSDFTKVGTPGKSNVKGPALKGHSSWVVWRSAYLTGLGAWRNRIQVPADWFRSWLFGRDLTRF